MKKEAREEAREEVRGEVRGEGRRPPLQEILTSCNPGFSVLNKKNRNTFLVAPYQSKAENHLPHHSSPLSSALSTPSP